MSSPGREFLERTSAAGGMHADDVLTSFLPLLKQVADWHDRGLVAPPLTLDDLTVDEHGRPGCRRGCNRAHTQHIRGGEAATAARECANVVGQARITSDSSATEVDNLQVQEEGTKLEHPVYLVGYRSWEEALGHHDALTDIFCLGQLLATFCSISTFPMRPTSAPLPRTAATSSCSMRVHTR